MTDVVSDRIAERRSTLARLEAAPFVATVFLSAVLVFLVQPMFARMATPLLGGSPNVWNVSLVCFQAALLGGYAYAHLLTHLIKRLRIQVAVHGGLLVLASLVLPFQLTGLLGQPDPMQPALWLVGVFAVSIAPPFAIISATAPLIQAWYARTGRPDAADPYHLYAASNAGSLLGLAAYPLLLEPLAPLAVQTNVWSLGYGALILLLVGCGMIAAKLNTGVAVPAETSIGAPIANRWRQRLWWVTLAFVPSSLLVGVTTHIATDVASAPFLWAPPLMLYIASFIVVFAKRPAISTALLVKVMPVVVGIALFTLSSAFGLASFFLHLGALFVAAVACHGLLVADRPATGRLTEFYLLMSLGGVLGGAFNALVVPVIFTSVAEYPLMLIILLLLMPQRYWTGSKRLLMLAAFAAAAAVAAQFVRVIPGDAGIEAFGFFLLSMMALVILFLVRESRLASAGAAAALWAIGSAASPTAGAYSERGFFGVVKVQEQDGFRMMVHGTTLHGAQSTGADSLRPTTYYAPETALGQVFAAHTAPGRVAVVGLGVGSVACFSKPGQQYTYFEIDPIVAWLASDPARFTFLSECTPGAGIVLGDGRLTLASEPEGAFNLMLIDAFSSDSVPAHLLTREAVALYMSRVRETDGIVLLHVSNRHMALATVVGRIAHELGLPGRLQFYKPPKGASEEATGARPTIVVALAHNEAALKRLDETGLWEPLVSDGKRGWSDDYSNIPGAIWDRIIHDRL